MKKVNIITLLLVFIIILSLLPTTALASTNSNIFNSNPLIDLKDSVIGGINFNADNYHFDNYGAIELLSFTEYAFSNDMTNYSLILYVYNSVQLDIKSNAGFVQLSIDDDTYIKYPLKLLSFSNDNMFVKLQISGISSVATALKGVEERNYNISGIELYDSNNNLIEYPVGTNYTYTGKSKGIDGQAESTLKCTSNELKTVTLDDINFASYRTWKTENIADQLTTAYFAVPNDIVDNYERLYSVQAETYKYLTSPVVVLFEKGTWLINFAEYYNNLNNQLGINMNGEGSTIGWDYVEYGAGAGGATQSGYNKHLGGLSRDLDVLSWLFQGNSSSDYEVSSTSMLRYAKNYSQNRSKTVLGKYNEDLFADKYYSMYGEDININLGYMPIDITADDDYTLIGSSSKLGFWDKFWGRPITTASEDICPIVTVTGDDLLNLTNNQISEKYLVDDVDIDDFKNKVYDNDDAGKTTYLFRFSQDPYITSKAYHSYGGFAGYMAQAPVFLNFDVISLGFEKSGIVTTIPCVCSPVDYFSGIESGSNINANNGLQGILKLILMMFALFVLLYILSLVLPIIINGVMLLGTVLSKPLGSTSKRSKKASRSKYKRK